MEDRTITLFQEDGKEIKADILFTYRSEEFNHNYVVFVVRGKNEASAAIYNETTDGKGTLDQITNEEEWALLEDVLNDYYDQLEKEEGDSCGSCECGEGCCCGGDCEGCN